MSKSKLTIDNFIGDWVLYHDEIYYAQSDENGDVQLYYCLTPAFHGGKPLHEISYEHARENLQICHLTEDCSNPVFL